MYHPPPFFWFIGNNDYHGSVTVGKEITYNNLHTLEEKYKCHSLHSGTGQPSDRKLSGPREG